MSIQLRLMVSNFLQFFVWGAWFVTLSTYLGRGLNFAGSDIGAAYSTMPWGAIVAPFLVSFLPLIVLHTSAAGFSALQSSGFILRSSTPAFLADGTSWRLALEAVLLLAGWLYLLMRAHQLKGGFFAGSYGWAILLGGILGSVMWANVWFVIWPNQKVVIASATQVAQGGQAIPEAAALGQRAGFASRTNTLFSIPMLFYMGAASHLSLFSSVTRGQKVTMAILCAAITLAVEANALYGTSGPTKKPLSTIKGTIHAGFILAVVFYLLFETVMRG